MSLEEKREKRHENQSDVTNQLSFNRSQSEVFR